ICIFILTDTFNFNNILTIQQDISSFSYVHFAVENISIFDQNSSDHPNIIEGQGSIGIEIIEQVPAVDAIIVPCGGGSLLCGIAISIKHLKPDTEIYGVETDKNCSMVESLRKNERIKMNISSTIADEIAVPMVGVNTFYNIKGLVDKMIVVKEDWVARAIMHIVKEEKLVVEGAGSVTIAAIMAGLFPNLKGKKVVCVISGGNINTTILARALERGMAAEGRLVKFKVTVSDRPGANSQLLKLIANGGYNLVRQFRDNSWIEGDTYTIETKLVCETRNLKHALELKRIIERAYPGSVFETEPFNDKRTCPCYVKKLCS
ncbi:L-threonine ammonia-lyase-like, partial [Galleria mellonella]|uniref:L-serine deaminase n=1 Tax=Galleria mellonella TaxID=7137 RepID=A0ABM3MZE8_GALME